MVQPFQANHDNPSAGALQIEIVKWTDRKHSFEALEGFIRTYYATYFLQERNLIQKRRHHTGRFLSLSVTRVSLCAEFLIARDSKSHRGQRLLNRRRQGAALPHPSLLTACHTSLRIDLRRLGSLGIHLGAFPVKVLGRLPTNHRIDRSAWFARTAWFEIPSQVFIGCPRFGRIQGVNTGFKRSRRMRKGTALQTVWKLGSGVPGRRTASEGRTVIASRHSSRRLNGMVTRIQHSNIS
jgi:hypothetical protein